MDSDFFCTVYTHPYLTQDFTVRSVPRCFLIMSSREDEYNLKMYFVYCCCVFIDLQLRAAITILLLGYKISNFQGE